MKNNYNLYVDTSFREYYSLNMLFADEILHSSSKYMFEKEIKAESTVHQSKDFTCGLFFKNISRYIDDVESYSVNYL